MDGAKLGGSAAGGPPATTRSPGGLQRMLGTGLPVLLASGLIYLLPLMARPFLSVSEYATWALGATVLSITLVFDLGSTPFVLTTAGTSLLTQRRLAASTALAVAGALAPGLALAALWPLYSQGRGMAMAGASGILYFVAITVAASLRSAALVSLAVMLATGRLHRRARALLGQAILQVVATAGSLWLGAGIWALPLGAFVSGACLLAYVRSGFIAPEEVRPATHVVRLRTYVRARLGLTALGLYLTQLDRWVVGLIVPVSAMATYDAASRIAGLPRLVIIALSGVLVADSSHAREAGVRAVAAVYQKALTATAGVGLVLATGVVAIAALPAFRSLAPLGLVAALTVAFTVHAVTAPGTQILNGIGAPQAEYRYLLPCAITTSASWVIAAATGSDHLALYASAANLLVWSVFFVFQMPSVLRRAS